MATPWAAVAETHSGVVFFAGDRAYKLKKPVDLGFLDFRTREARRTACHREVELNRRLAPDVYLGVADVLDAEGEPCDHLVVMRRMPAERRLSTLVTAGAPVEDCLRRVARALAAFHAHADTSTDIEAVAGRDALAERWEANLSESGSFVDTLLDRQTVERVAWLARRYVAGRASLFAARIADGRARDGHGDLLADDIFCLDDGPRILDCLEFDDQLRYDDVLADISFLAMDLERLGRADLATLFLAHYRELSGDTWPSSLVHHHIAYRALVRAKVSCFRHAQGEESSAGAARELLGMARAHLEAGRVRLVVVGGLPGTGKSVLASGLAEALGAVLLRSDEMRKELAGLRPTDRAPAPFGKGLYDADVTAATYGELLDRAGSALAMGESVVLDAAWHDPGWRGKAAELAEVTVSDLTELRCVAPLEVAAERLRRRAATDTDPSDATAEIAAAMAATEAPWPSAVDIDTTAAPEEVLAMAFSVVG